MRECRTCVVVYNAFVDVFKEMLENCQVLDTEFNNEGKISCLCGSLLGIVNEFIVAIWRCGHKLYCRVGNFCGCTFSSSA